MQCDKTVNRTWLLRTRTRKLVWTMTAICNWGFAILTCDRCRFEIALLFRVRIAWSELIYSSELIYDSYHPSRENQRENQRISIHRERIWESDENRSRGLEFLWSHRNNKYKWVTERERERGWRADNPNGRCPNPNVAPERGRDHWVENQRMSMRNLCLEVLWLDHNNKYRW